MEKRMLNLTEAARYIGLGKTKARTELERMKCKRHFGRRVVYDILAIDRYLDNETQRSN